MWLKVWLFRSFATIGCHASNRLLSIMNWTMLKELLLLCCYYARKALSVVARREGFWRSKGTGSFPSLLVLVPKAVPHLFPPSELIFRLFWTTCSRQAFIEPWWGLYSLVNFGTADSWGGEWTRAWSSCWFMFWYRLFGIHLIKNIFKIFFSVD